MVAEANATISSHAKPVAPAIDPPAVGGVIGALDDVNGVVAAARGAIGARGAA